MQVKRSVFWMPFLVILLITTALGSCKKDKVKEISGVCPIVISTNPANLATGVPLATVITVTFNEKMNPSTINAGTIIITGGNISGAVSYDGVTATYTPSAPLVANTTYTGRVTTGVKDEFGLALQTDYIWTFTTGITIAPVVISTDPENNDTAVFLNKVVSADFSMNMDPATFTATSFTLKSGTTSIIGLVAYSGITATFTPLSPLIANTVYDATITTAVKNAAGIPIAANYTWKFTTGSLIAPKVIATDPLNNATGVALNKVVTATFSMPMDLLTITNSTFTIKQGTNIIPGVVTYTGSTASFTPNSPFVEGLLYTATITTGARNIAGTPLANNYIWSFTTAFITAPLVVSTDPKNNEIGVPLNKTVMATFNMMMDPATINGATFTLKQGATIISGVVTYAGYVASFKPTINLTAGTIYTATITTGAKNPGGISLASNYVWSFTTGTVIAPVVTSTDPINLAIGVPLNKTITATFSMAMDPLTINSTSFTLMQGTNSISGLVTYAGTIASFKPTLNLTPGLVYTATITTASKNTGGVALANNYVWTFTTLATAAPLVISTDPISNATGVPLNKVIKATFNMAMDPLTINSTTFLVKQGTTVVTGVVTYAANIASFTPSADLIQGKIYTATITTGAKSVSNVSLANDYVWNFTTVIITAPTVIATDPANLSINITLNKLITATFSMNMDPTTINTTTFLVKQGVVPVAGTVTYSGVTATFTPTTNLIAGKVYTATITTGAKNTFGISLASDYVWSFSTAGVPVVVLTDPSNLATNVPLNKVITAAFNMNMDPTTINNTTFLVKDGIVPVLGVVTYSGAIATFTPSANLTAGKTYSVTITTGAKSTFGIPMAADYNFSFTTIAPPPTVISTDPANNATNVALDKIISATFSVPMDPTTINNVTFTLKLGSSSVSGTVSYLGSTAKFTPTVKLLSDTDYTATITTGAKNVAGVSLVSNYVWTFRTVQHLGPAFVDLKSVGRFGIIAGTGISNNAGFSVINDQDVGISPGARSSVTGFQPAIVVNGAIYASDDLVPAGVAAMLTQAKADLTAAYLFAEGATAPAPVTVSGDQGGKTLAPGIYKSTSTLSIQNGDLTLDAHGDANAIWIFQVASAFTTVGGAGGNVILSGGAQAKNIFWQTGSSATIGGATTFYGNVLALTSITMGGYSTMTGRLLARNGAVVLTSTDIINKP